jgi:hypothetical protein
MRIMPLATRTTPQDKPASPCLVEIIELKWLLRGHGIDVHVERLQTEPEYARRVLELAAATPNAALRMAALRLRDVLALDD